MLGAVITKALSWRRKIIVYVQGSFVIMVRLVANGDNSKKPTLAEGKTGGQAIFATHRPPGNPEP
jgi:hypothetical protein